MGSPDIFISYNREDSPVAQFFRDALKTEGFDVWWDATLRPGETYDEVTEAALRAAKAVVVLWSPRSVVSRWVRAEATIADKNKTLVPVMIEPCDRPVLFELTQTADLTNWRGDSGDKDWCTFVGSLRGKVSLAESIETKPSTQSNPLIPAVKDGGVPFVAVLPFRNRGDDVVTQMLAGDLTEDITRILARNHFFKVIAATTMAAWRGKEIDYAVMRSRLDARYFVEGIVQQNGENVRLSLQLVDADTTSMVWSERFIGKVADLEFSPDEFTRDCANQLSEKILQTEVDRALNKDGQLTGWDYLLRAAVPTMRRMDSESMRNAIHDARKAVELAPANGLAHAILAALLGSVMTRGTDTPNQELRQEILGLVRRAMHLDGDNARVLLAIVGAYAAIGDVDAGLRLAQRAVQLDPYSIQAHFALGRAYLTKGLTSQAQDALGKYLHLGKEDHMRLPALALDGMCLFIEGKPEAARKSLDEALAHHPDFGVALRWKAIVEAELGQELTAHQTMMRLKEVEPGLTLEQHLAQIVTYPALSESTSSAVATFRKLWGESGGDV